MADAPAGSSFEADLRAIREDRGISVDAIEQATRVPADVVRRFEAGALMEDPDYSVVYLRAFVKAYAEALDLSTSQTNTAFDAARQGAYRGELRTALGATAAEAPASKPPGKPAPPAPKATAPKATAPKADAEQDDAEQDDAPASKDASKKDASAKKPPKRRSQAEADAPAGAAASKEAAKRAAPDREAPPKTETPRPKATPPPSKRAADAPPPAVAALAQEPVREPRTVEPAAAPRRSGPPSGVNTSERSWGLIVGIAVLSLLALAVVFLLIFRDPAPDLEPVATAPAADTTAAPDTTQQQPAAVPPAPQIGDTLRVTVVAADGPLQDFRVQEVPDVRRPYWLEQGNEQTFSSAEEVIVWGVETANGWRIDPDARLRVAGLTWAPSDVVRLSRANAQALVDSLHRAQYGG